MRISTINMRGKFGTAPLFVKFVRFLLLNPVVARDMEAVAVISLQVRIGRLRAKPFEIGREMSFKYRQRIVRFGCSSKPSGTRT